MQIAYVLILIHQLLVYTNNVFRAGLPVHKKTAIHTEFNLLDLTPQWWEMWIADLEILGCSTFPYCLICKMGNT
jgi:hypothetical protein